MSQYPYDQPPQQYSGNQYQGQYPQQPPTAYGQPEYGQPGYNQDYNTPSLQQQPYQPTPQPYAQNQVYQNPYNPGAYGMPAAQPGQGGGLAIAGMVLGIVSIALFWAFYLGLPVAIVGLILSILARRSPIRRGMATAGLVCSIIGLALSLCDGGVILYTIIHAASTSGY